MIPTRFVAVGRIQNVMVNGGKLPHILLVFLEESSRPKRAVHELAYHLYSPALGLYSKDHYF